MSLIRGSEIKRGNSSIITPAIEISDEKVPICAIKFLEASAEIICCGTVAGGGHILHVKRRILYHHFPHLIQGVGRRDTGR